MILNVIVLLSMGLLASSGSFLLKKAVTNGISIWKLLTNAFFWGGGVLYIISALLNLYLLRILPYSIVVPLGALTYIWTMLISHKFLGERITRQKVIGVLLILIGVALISLI